MERPADLPDFDNPPLNELVVGVQFNPAAGYSQIRAGDVWKLFSEEFPTVQEQVPLAPQFEIFGLPTPPSFNFSMVEGGQHDRFWFVSADQHELIQFQEDRLLHNWRQVAGLPNKPYPRFEAICDKFDRELNVLQAYFQTLEQQVIDFTQAEISYINHIVLAEAGHGSKIDDWLTVFNFGAGVAEDVASLWRRTLLIDGKPFARLIVDLKTGTRPDRRQIAVLTLTVRGMPSGKDIANVIDFITFGRRIIVEEFASITSDFAHNAWDRTK